MPYVGFGGPIPSVKALPSILRKWASPILPASHFRLSQAMYRPLFVEVRGKGSFEINFPRETEQICTTPGGAAVFGGSTTPIPLSAAELEASTKTPACARTLPLQPSLQRKVAFCRGRGASMASESYNARPAYSKSHLCGFKESQQLFRHST
jgi:hypothetical protein